MSFSCPLHGWHDHNYCCPLCITTVTGAGVEAVIDFVREVEKGLPDKELIEKLKTECRRVKMQRNDYEDKLKLANREINRLSTELKLFKNPLKS